MAEMRVRLERRAMIIGKVHVLATRAEPCTVVGWPRTQVCSVGLECPLPGRLQVRHVVAQIISRGCCRGAVVRIISLDDLCSPEIGVLCGLYCIGRTLNYHP